MPDKHAEGNAIVAAVSPKHFKTLDGFLEERLDVASKMCNTFTAHRDEIVKMGKSVLQKSVEEWAKTDRRAKEVRRTPLI